jgi:methyl-accepting chemotaxis protein
MRKIQTKLLVLSLASLACLVAFAALLLRNVYFEYRDLASFKETSLISQTAYELAKNITDERQAAYYAATFLGEGTPAEILENYRRRTTASDAVLEQLRAGAAAHEALFSPRFRDGLSHAVEAQKPLQALRAEILDPARPQVQDINSKLKSKALQAYDVVLNAQANFLPVLCNETRDAELVRKIITVDNIARLQKDIWKVKGLIGSALRQGKVNEGAAGELKVKMVSVDDQLSRLRNLADPQVAAAVHQLSTGADFKAIYDMGMRLKDAVGKPQVVAELGDPTAYQKGPNAQVELAFAELSQTGLAQIRAYTDERLVEARRHLVGLGCTSVLAVAGIGLLITLIARSITRPLSQVSGELADTATGATCAADVIAESSQRLSDDACEQAAALEEISSSMEELASMTNSNLDHMQRMAQLTETALRATDKGVQNAADLSAAMSAMEQATRDVASILKTIDEIAFQTNILALNAAVEAARAGEAGAGFGVVADEVRALAQRSAAAARETATKIEAAVKSCGEGAALGKISQQQFTDIARLAKECHQMAKEVDASSHQTTHGLAQVNEAVTKVDQITQRTAGAAQENASASTEMKAQVVRVLDCVKKLEAMIVSTAISRAPAKAPAGDNSELPRDEPVVTTRAQKPGPAASGHVLTR